MVSCTDRVVDYSTLLRAVPSRMQIVCTGIVSGDSTMSIGRMKRGETNNAEGRGAFPQINGILALFLICTNLDGRHTRET